MDYLKTIFSTAKKKKMAKMYILTSEFSFEVAEKDQFETMTWMDAKNCGTSLGPGWRLPTPEELQVIFKLHEKAIGDFCNDKYWTSLGSSNWHSTCINFIDGSLNNLYYSNSYRSSNPPPKHCVRLIKNF